MSELLTRELFVREVGRREGRPVYLCHLDAADGPSIHIYEGQLKELIVVPEAGKRYKASFRAFVNNRWLELKLAGLEELGDG